MRQQRDPKSPFGVRLYFEPNDFERMMDELRNRAGHEAFAPNRGVDVDLVLLRALNLEPSFVDLPIGILGRTVFAPNGRAKIEISRSLTDAAETDSAARRRYRTTLAHEIGHAVCHPQLFMEDSFTRRLFGNQQAAARETSKILCRETEVGQFKYKGEWWEYQANQCMAALLLPVRLFREATERAMSGLGFVSFEDAIRSGRADALVRELSDFFDVSQEAVFYRLDHLGFVPKSGEARLPL